MHGEIPGAAPAAQRSEPLVVPGAGRIRRDALDPNALSVVLRLQRMGHEAYLVGGCVRDLLLGLEPKDFDVATDAPPNRIKRIFRNAFIIGRRFRLAHIRFEGGSVVEAATFRADPGDQGAAEGAEEGPIRSDNVFGTAIEDAFRRDFTVNALFYDPERDVVVDWVGGLADIESRVIRSIGDPDRRLREDPVRIIRALHFAARMGGTVEPSLLEAIRARAGDIAKASPSRLYVELMKMLTRGSARPTIRALYDLKVLTPWLPELVAFLDLPIAWPSEGGGTHEAAREGEPEDTPGGHLTWNLLAAADAWGMAARGVPESLAVAVLLGPWLLESFARGPRRGHDLVSHVEEAFRPIALRMSVPRRVSYELREILWMLERLKHAPDQKRRLRSLVLRPSFPEALAYFGLDLRAKDRSLEPLDAWHAVADEVWTAEESHRRARATRAPDPFDSESDQPAPLGDDSRGDAMGGPVEDRAPESQDGPRRRRRRRGDRGRGGRPPPHGANPPTWNDNAAEIPSSQRREEPPPPPPRAT